MGVPQEEPGDKQRLANAPRIPDNKPAKGSGGNDDEPPEIPPRMKKKGPELPEKPPHLRLATLTKINPSTSLPPSSQTEFGKNVVPTFTNLNKSRQPSTDQKLFLENARRKTAATDREILVAATKGARERPPEKRQREPAKLLTSTFKVPEDDDDGGSLLPNDALPILLGLASPKPHRRSTGNSSQKPVSFKTNSSSKVSARANARYPVLLVPRSQLDTRNLQQFWSSYPMSYGVWVQNSGSGDPQMTSRMVRKAHGPSAVELRPATAILFNNSSKPQKKSSSQHHNRHQLETKIFVSGKNSKNSAGGGGGDSGKPRSSSVTRSGSLTSHDSTSSDSGNEMFPKSVLKKHRRETPNAVNTSTNNKKNVEHKKNVTFNAFATVQLMEE